LDYHWPGNIRELKNVVERAVYRSNNPNLPVHNIVLDPFESIYRPQKRIKTQDRIVQPEVVTTAVTSAETLLKDQTLTEPRTNSAFEFPVDLKELSQEFEIDLINQALNESQFNQKKTADKLGLTYHQLRGYLKKYNLLEQTNEDMD
jgi:psp operon transcriptional activator